MIMEKEEKQNGVEQKKSSSPSSLSKVLDPEFKLQWGKRMKCNRRKLTSRIVSHASSADPPFSFPSRLNRVAEGPRFGKSPSPEKEERYYSTRGSTAGEEKENGRSSVEGNGVGIGVDIGREAKGNLVWPKLYITLSSKEKEEDFLAMKGCKLPQRPKKRAKLIQRTLLLVSPGAWLTDLCRERYEVREKKTPKKKPRGLKAMGNIVDTDSE